MNPAWGKKPPPSRGPKPKLALNQIARAAIELADAEGLQAVTMQRVARTVGITTMALYRYFAGKPELLDLMIDSVSVSAPRFGNPSSQWSERLKRWAQRCLSIYRDHPWFLEATSARRSVMGPNELLWMEAALSMLAESGLAPEDRHNAFLALIAHVRGHATFQQVKTDTKSRQHWKRELVQLLESDADRYPALLQAVRQDAFSKSQNAFDFGLDCILEGVRLRATQAGASNHSGSGIMGQN